MSDEGCLVRVVGKLGGRDFDAGIVFDQWGGIVACAPILKPYLTGKTRDQVREVLQAHDWRASMVPILTGPQIKAN